MHVFIIWSSEVQFGAGQCPITGSSRALGTSSPRHAFYGQLWCCSLTLGFQFSICLQIWSKNSSFPFASYGYETEKSDVNDTK